MREAQQYCQLALIDARLLTSRRAAASVMHPSSYSIRVVREHAENVLNVVSEPTGPRVCDSAAKYSVCLSQS